MLEAESIVSFVVEKLGNLVIEESVFLHGVADEVAWMKTELERMQCFLIDAEDKGREGNETVRDWVQYWVPEVRDVAYQVDNVIDNVMYMIRRRRLRGFIGCMSRYAHIPEELISLHKIGTEIEGIKNKIGDISASIRRYEIAIQRYEIAIRRYEIAHRCASADEAHEVTSDIDDTLQFDVNIDDTLQSNVDRDVVGVEDDKKDLIKQLLDLNNARRCVISIVGKGGLGKTTLASKIYNSSDIKRHFSILVWLTISQDYTTIGLLNDIHEKVTGNRTDKGEEYLRRKIYEFLKEVRYLIVLDDVWENVVWDKIHEVFPDKNNGSRVMLTSRKIDVTKYSYPITLCELHPLNDKESWELFCEKAFPNRQTRCPDHLTGLSRQLVRMCGGLPLALVVLGGFLSTKEPTRPVWLNVIKSMVQKTTVDEQQCLSILALSYNDLPRRLKSCFIYTSAFPGNRDISVSLLIRLWIAEGFISQSYSQTLEETARRYLDELVERCMVQVTAKSLAHGWAKRIRIHDMLRGLCISEARNDGIMNICSSNTDNSNSSSSAMAARRLAVHSIAAHSEHPIFPTDLRSLLLFVAVDSSRSLIKLERLRVLHQQGWIGPTVNLRRSKHLRYLRLPKFLPMESCGPSIKNLLPTLYNLITLDMVRGVQVHGIFWESPTLRHLYIREDPIRPPAKFSFFNLQVLWRVRAGKWIGKSLANHINLRKLGISYISTSHHEELTTSLRKLDRLVTLQLHSNQSIPTEVLSIFQNQHHLHVLKLYGEFSKGPQLPPSNEFPPRLTKLLLSDCKLEHDPMPTLEKLPNLIYLHLDGEAYVGKSMSCSGSGFPRLLKLMLVGLFNMEDWSITKGAMPKLTQLSINWCPNLTMLPHGLEYVTSLQELQLSNMSEEFIDRVDKKYGEDWNKITHVPSIIIRGVLRED